MNIQTACLILGVSRDIDADSLKKQYHRLMSLTHPDVGGTHDYPYEAGEINEAYEFLAAHLNDEIPARSRKEEKRIRWNAQVNGNACAEREIYQYCEDQDGKRIGFITVDTGKFMWMPDEDFPLFLKSLYNLGRKLIAEDDEIKGSYRVDNTELLAEITYLLAGQFFGTANALDMMKKCDGSEDIYYAKAMLELIPECGGPKAKENISLKPGDILLPAGIKNRRLYVRKKEGKILGYITFVDDRLSFGIIPLFERRAAKLKMRVSSGAKRGSADVDLWLKPVSEDTAVAVESINLKIRDVLDKFI